MKMEEQERLARLAKTIGLILEPSELAPEGVTETYEIGFWKDADPLGKVSYHKPTDKLTIEVHPSVPEEIVDYVANVLKEDKDAYSDRFYLFDDSTVEMKNV